MFQRIICFWFLLLASFTCAFAAPPTYDVKAGSRLWFEPGITNFYVNGVYYNNLIDAINAMSKPITNINANVSIAGALLTNGSIAMGAPLNMGNFTITNLANGVNAKDAVTLSQLIGATNSIAVGGNQVFTNQNNTFGTPSTNTFKSPTFFQAVVDLGGSKITNLASGTATLDAVNLGQLQGATGGVFNITQYPLALLTNGTRPMGGVLNFGNNQATNLANGTTASAAVNLSQLQGATNGVESLTNGYAPYVYVNSVTNFAITNVNLLGSGTPTITNINQQRVGAKSLLAGSGITLTEAGGSNITFAVSAGVTNPFATLAFASATTNFALTNALKVGSGIPVITNINNQIFGGKSLVAGNNITLTEVGGTNISIASTATGSGEVFTNVNNTFSVNSTNTFQAPTFHQAIIDLGGNKITNMANGTASKDAVTLSQLQGATNGYALLTYANSLTNNALTNNTLLGGGAVFWATTNINNQIFATKPFTNSASITWNEAASNLSVSVNAGVTNPFTTLTYANSLTNFALTNALKVGSGISIITNINNQIFGGKSLLAGNNITLTEVGGTNISIASTATGSGEVFTNVNNTFSVNSTNTFYAPTFLYGKGNSVSNALLLGATTNQGDVVIQGNLTVTNVMTFGNVTIGPTYISGGTFTNDTFINPFIWTQRLAYATAARIDWDLNLGNNATVTLTNGAVFNVSNIKPGYATLQVIQDSKGGWFPFWSNAFLATGGNIPITTNANSTNLVAFVSYNGTQLMATGATNLMYVSVSSDAGGSPNQVFTNQNNTFSANSINTFQAPTFFQTVVDLGGNKITNMANGTASKDAVTLSQLQGATNFSQFAITNNNLLGGGSVVWLLTNKNSNVIETKPLTNSASITFSEAASNITAIVNAGVTNPFATLAFASATTNFALTNNVLLGAGIQLTTNVNQQIFGSKSLLAGNNITLTEVGGTNITIAGTIPASATNAVWSVVQYPLALLTNGTRAMGNSLNMGVNTITNLANGANAQDATALTQLWGATNGVQNLTNGFVPYTYVDSVTNFALTNINLLGSGTPTITNINQQRVGAKSLLAGSGITLTEVGGTNVTFAVSAGVTNPFATLAFANSLTNLALTNNALIGAGIYTTTNINNQIFASKSLLAGANITISEVGGSNITISASGSGSASLTNFCYTNNQLLAGGAVIWPTTNINNQIFATKPFTNSASITWSEIASNISAEVNAGVTNSFATTAYADSLTNLCITNIYHAGSGAYTVSNVSPNIVAALGLRNGVLITVTNVGSTNNIISLTSSTSGKMIVANAGGTPAYVTIAGDGTIGSSGTMTIYGLLTNGTRAMGANLNMGQFEITNMADGSTASSAVNLSQLQGATNGIESLTNGYAPYVYVNSVTNFALTNIFLSGSGTPVISNVNKQVSFAKSLIAGTGITITEVGGTNVTLTASASDPAITNFCLTNNFLSGSGTPMTTNINSKVFWTKSLLAGANITLTEVGGTNVTIAASGSGSSEVFTNQNNTFSVNSTNTFQAPTYFRDTLTVSNADASFVNSNLFVRFINTNVGAGGVSLELYRPENVNGVVIALINANNYRATGTIPADLLFRSENGSRHVFSAGTAINAVFDYSPARPTFRFFGDASISNSITGNGTDNTLSNQTISTYASIITQKQLTNTTLNAFQYPLALLTNGSIAMGAPLNMGNFTITNLANGVNAKDAINLSQLQSATNGAAFLALSQTFTGSNIFLGQLGQPYAAQTFAITNVLDLGDGGAKFFTITNDAVFITSNRYNGGKLSFRIIGDTNNVNHTITWPTGWHNLGGTLQNTIQSNEALRLSIYAAGTNDSDIDAIVASDQRSVLGSTFFKGVVDIGDNLITNLTYASVSNQAMAYGQLFGATNNLNASRLVSGQVPAAVIGTGTIDPNRLIVGNPGWIIVGAAASGGLRPAWTNLSGDATLNSNGVLTIVAGITNAIWGNAQYPNSVLIDGSRAITAPFNAGNQSITNLANGSVATDAATLGQVWGATNLSQFSITNLVRLAGGSVVWPGTNITSNIVALYPFTNSASINFSLSASNISAVVNAGVTNPFLPIAGTNGYILKATADSTYLGLTSTNIFVDTNSVQTLRNKIITDAIGLTGVATYITPTHRLVNFSNVTHLVVDATNNATMSNPRGMQVASSYYILFIQDSVGGRVPTSWSNNWYAMSGSINAMISTNPFSTNLIALTTVNGSDAIVSTVTNILKVP